MEITLTLDTDQVADIVLAELVEAFDTLESEDIELVNSFAKVLRYYMTNKQWNKFMKQRGLV